MVTKQPRVDPLTWNISIVGDDGRPSPEFMRKWQQQHGINDTVPWNAASASAVLDFIAATTGSILVRGVSLWGGLVAPSDATKFLNGAIPPAFAQVKDSDLSTSDITTNNVTAAKHGFTPKLPNDATKYLDGTGAYTVPADNDPLLGTGVPSVLEPAGWLYSRSAAKELYQSNPTSTPPVAVVQHKSAINGNTIPGAITLTGAPVAGHLIIAFLHTNLFASAVTVNTPGWTVFEDVRGSLNPAAQRGMGLYRYAVLGDTATLPAFWTAGSTYWAYQVYEISGVSGVFATDVPLHGQAESDVNVTSLASGTLVTTLPNALALIGAGQYNGNADPTLSAGWTRDEFGHNSSNYGSGVGGSQAIAASGTSVNATVTFTTSSTPADLMLAVIQAPTVQAAHWDLLANASFGTVTSVGLALPAIFTVSGSPVTSTGTLTGTLATQAANAVWAGPVSGAAATPAFRALVAADLPTGVLVEAIVLPTTEILAAGALVNIFNNAGTPSCRNAVATSVAKSANGYVLAGFGSGASATVYLAGQNTPMQATVANAGPVFLSAATPGAATLTPPAAAGNVVQRVGVAYSTTAMQFNPGQPFVLS